MPLYKTIEYLSANPSIAELTAPSAEEWIEQCAWTLAQIDPQLARQEARSLACEMFQFERTAAMRPEEAADFVAAEMSHPRPRFERRLVHRP